MSGALASQPRFLKCGNAAKRDGRASQLAWSGGFSRWPKTFPRQAIHPNLENQAGLAVHVQRREVGRQSRKDLLREHVHAPPVNHDCSFTARDLTMTPRHRKQRTMPSNGSSPPFQVWHWQVLTPTRMQSCRIVGGITVSQAGQNVPARAVLISESLWQWRRCRQIAGSVNVLRAEPSALRIGSPAIRAKDCGGIRATCPRRFRLLHADVTFHATPYEDTGMTGPFPLTLRALWITGIPVGGIG